MSELRKERHLQRQNVYPEHVRIALAYLAPFAWHLAADLLRLEALLRDACASQSAWLGR